MSRQPWTPEREKEYQRRYYAKHGDRIRARKRELDAVRRYGIARAEIDAMCAAQGGLCKLCGIKPDSALHVDHDHRTERVRALLCGTCNQALGLLRDDPSLMRKAAEYVEEHR